MKKYILIAIFLVSALPVFSQVRLKQIEPATAQDYIIVSQPTTFIGAWTSFIDLLNDNDVFQSVETFSITTGSSGGTITLGLTDDGVSNSTIDIEESVEDIINGALIGGTDIDVVYSDGGGTITINSTASAGTTVTIEESGVSVGTVSTFDFGSGFDITESPADEGNIDIDLTEIQEAFEDQIGNNMVNNVTGGISYDDANGDLEIDVDELASVTATTSDKIIIGDQSDSYNPKEITIAALDALIGGGTDDQTIDLFTISSDILSISAEDDGEAPKTVDLSPYLDQTSANDQANGLDIVESTNQISIDYDFTELTADPTPEGDELLIFYDPSSVEYQTVDVNDLPYLVTEVDGSITNELDNTNWDLQVNGGSTEVIGDVDGENVNFVESGGIDITRSGNTVTIDGSGIGGADGNGMFSTANDGASVPVVSGDYDISLLDDVDFDAGLFYLSNVDQVVGVGTTAPDEKYKLDVRYSGGDESSTTAGIYGERQISASSTDAHNGVWGKGTSSHSSGTVGTLTGVSGSAFNEGSGDITTIHGFRSTAFVLSSGDVGTAVGNRVAVGDSGSGSITTGYGIWVDEVDGTTARGIMIDDITGSTSHGIYQAGSNDDNYFAGDVGIGDSSPDAALDVEGQVYLNDYLRLQETSSGTGATSLDFMNTVDDDDAWRVMRDGDGDFRISYDSDSPYLGEAIDGLTIGENGDISNEHGNASHGLRQKTKR